MPILHCFNFYRFTVNFEIRKCEVTTFIYTALYKILGKSQKKLKLDTFYIGKKLYRNEWKIMQASI